MEKIIEFYVLADKEQKYFYLRHSGYGTENILNAQRFNTKEEVVYEEERIMNYFQHKIYTEIITVHMKITTKTHRRS